MFKYLDGKELFRFKYTQI